MNNLNSSNIIKEINSHLSNGDSLSKSEFADIINRNNAGARDTEQSNV